MIKYGIKLWSNNKYRLFKEAVLLYKENIIDFIELYIVPKTLTEKKIELLKLIPVAIHAPHKAHGLDLSIKNKQNKNLINETKNIADMLKSKIIVIHPGRKNKSNAIKENLKIFSDNRFLIENMPFVSLPQFGKKKLECSTYSDIKNITRVNKKICLDFSHAIKSSISQKINYKRFIKKLINNFSPFYFHISDGSLNNQYDEHLNLGNGEFDIKWIKKTIKYLPINKDYKIVFETPAPKNNLTNYIKNIKFFKDIRV